MSPRLRRPSLAAVTSDFACHARPSPAPPARSLRGGSVCADCLDAVRCSRDGFCWKAQQEARRAERAAATIAPPLDELVRFCLWPECEEVVEQDYCVEHGKERAREFGTKSFAKGKRRGRVAGLHDLTLDDPDPIAAVRYDALVLAAYEGNEAVDA